MARRLGKESAQWNVEKSNDAIGPAQTARNLETEQFIGKSPAFNAIVETIQAVAARRCSIVITGETGTGKEMVARQIHLNSDRAEGIFVPVDCTTLTGELFESQLFGHVRGAFTGAVDNTLGFFRSASGGTIFLDEIGEIPIELQAKLLRVLQEGKVTPLGSTKSYPVDVRVICATNRDLREMVRLGTFRADLFYRLNVITVELPPLRQRPEDVEILAAYFMERQSRFYNEPVKVLSPAAKRLILNYAWPGNIRELANAMEHAYVLTPSYEVEASALPMEVVLSGITSKTNSSIPTMEEAKRLLVIQALEHTKCRKVAAAQLLGIERRALNRMIHKFNISLSQLKHSTAKN